jgi:antitoxin (DNA-binding transcriptional repressor) of toxin-antitoxin stability system
MRALVLTLAELETAMKTVNVHEAKTTLSQPLAEVERGEDVVIARDSIPVAHLAALQPMCFCRV